MDIEILAPGCEILLPSGARQKFPVGWTGAVDNALGEAWVGAGLARPTIGVAGGFDEAQTAVLKAIADQALAEHQAHEQVAGMIEALRGMSDDELGQLVAAAGLKLAKKASRDDIIDAIVRHELGVADDAAEVETAAGGDEPAEKSAT